VKIWYFNEKYPYEDPSRYHKQYPCGGSEVVADYLAVEMAKRDNTVDFFSTGINRSKVTERRGEVNLKRYPRRFEVMGRCFNPSVLFDAGRDLPDMVHAHVCTEVFFTFASWWWAKRKRRPLVLTCHINAGSYPDHFPYHYKLALKGHKVCIDMLFSLADVIISPSEGFALENETLRKHKKKVVVIPNGINFAEFELPQSKEECRRELGLPQDKKILLFLGNPHPNKGLEVLLRAMVRIAGDVPESKLVIVGRGTEEARMRSVAGELGLGESVEFAGFASGVRKNMFYRAADIFVLPSFYDIFPLTTLEASIFGLPLVVSDIGAFGGFVDGDYNGLITKAGDSEDLARQLTDILLNDDLRLRIGKNARERVEDYSWAKIAERTEDLYKSLLSR